MTVVKTAEMGNIVSESEVHVMLVTLDCESTARNFSERHKLE
jgi:hypothetical protein